VSFSEFSGYISALFLFSGFDSNYCYF